MDGTKIVRSAALAVALAFAGAANIAAWAELSTANTLSRAGAESAAQTGIFDGRGDVGTVLHPGSAEYAAAKGSYTMASSGENVWFSKDAFQ